jgi:hypothetical protein
LHHDRPRSSFAKRLGNERHHRVCQGNKEPLYRDGLATRLQREHLAKKFLRPFPARDDDSRVAANNIVHNPVRNGIRQGTTIKEPAVPDIEWHGRPFAIAGVISYAKTIISHT